MGRWSLVIRWLGIPVKIKARQLSQVLYPNTVTSCTQPQSQTLIPKPSCTQPHSQTLIPKPSCTQFYSYECREHETLGMRLCTRTNICTQTCTIHTHTKIHHTHTHTQLYSILNLDVPCTFSRWFSRFTTCWATLSFPLCLFVAVACRPHMLTR